jgi:hypothetical protein
MNYKILLASFILGAFPALCFSQDSRNGNRRIEIGVGTPYIGLFGGRPCPSLSIKDKFDKNAIRGGINYSNTLFEANIGYERTLIGKKLQPFAGVDLGYTSLLYLHYRYWTLLGAGPVIGIEYHITDRFFLQTEVGAFTGRWKMYSPEDSGWWGISFHRWISLHAGITLYR